MKKKELETAITENKEKIRTLSEKKQKWEQERQEQMKTRKTASERSVELVREIQEIINKIQQQIQLTHELYQKNIAKEAGERKIFLEEMAGDFIDTLI